MELATRITGVEQVGDWFRFKVAEGFEVSTKHGDVANTAKELMGQPVLIDYVEKTSEKINPHTGVGFINRYLNGVLPNHNGASAQQVIPTEPSAPVTADERGARMGRNNLAAAATPTLLQMTDGKPETLQKILDGLAKWSETGESIFTTPDANPTFTTAPAEDDIPF